MAKLADRQPQASTVDIEAYAAVLASTAPPLTPDQLDALGQIIRSVPSVPKSPPTKPGRVGRRKHRQLELPYDQINTELPGAALHGRQIRRRQVIRNVKEHPVA